MVKRSKRWVWIGVVGTDVAETGVSGSGTMTEGHDDLPGRVRKWDMHIHCDQYFQFRVFEILVVSSFDLVFGPVE